MKRVLLLFLLSSPALAHDFWLEPTDFTPEPGQVIGIRVKVGEHLPGEARRRDPEHVARFFARAGGETVPVAGAAGAEPAGSIRFPEGAGMVIAYESRTRHVDLKPAVFAEYLKEEGLENRIARAAGTVRDTYSRAAKAIVRTPGRPVADATVALGLAMEIVPLSDPFAPGRLELQVLFDGRPLEGTLVTAIRRGAPVSGRTNAAGRVTLDLQGAGVWLVKSVHAVRTGDAAVRSWWASLTFER